MKHKSLIVRQGFYEEEMGSSSVGVERFELPISCSQSRRVTFSGNLNASIYVAKTVIIRSNYGNIIQKP